MTRFRRTIALVGLSAWLCFVAVPGRAQDEAPSTDTPADAVDASESRASAFRAVTGPNVERVPGGTLLVAAYGIVLLVLLGYVYRLGALHARTTRDLARIEKSVFATRSQASEPKG